MKRIRLEELPMVTSPRGPKIRKVLSTDDIVVANVVLEPGQVLPSHKTPVDVLFYVHSGSGNVIIGDEDSDFSVLVIKTPNPDISKDNE